ncbi:hypothetical protein EZJ43_13240 [Pedobacter changchengzhani]|uniref:Lipoprotein n=1 Tax=Pedobacter changchengzhani TaxID=2529274 RepID=A0A4R5MJ36_9SPHI|nr:hypothetical protein [Pedobacter changchengzhani]TDG35580.1 hypothetical protein EZJ43_13240 [Pedobacter changchengzhani]
MNKLKATFFIYLIIIIFPFTILSCQSKNDKDFVWFVVQPEAEIGKSIDFSIHFEEKPDSIYTNVKEIDGLELTNNLDRVHMTSENSITDENDKVIKTFYEFYTYAKPTRLGRIDFPIMTVLYKGKEYKSKPFHINVVDKITIDKNDIKVIWSADKSSYKKTDTIKLTLYEYSKFSENNRTSGTPKSISLTGKNNQINLGVEETIDNIAGIDDFEKLINQKFEIVDVDWNILKNRQSMEEIEGEFYIRTLILGLHLLPKTQKNFILGESYYDYHIYKNNTDYFKEYVPNDEGSYNITENGSTILKVKSNKLTIKME